MVLKVCIFIRFVIGFTERSIESGKTNVLTELYDTGQWEIELQMQAPMTLEVSENIHISEHGRHTSP